MDPLTLIAMAGALLKIIGQANDAFGKIKASLEQNTELTEEERAAFEELKKSDYAKDYWQPND